MSGFLRIKYFYSFILLALGMPLLATAAAPEFPQIQENVACHENLLPKRELKRRVQELIRKATTEDAGVTEKVVMRLVNPIVSRKIIQKCKDRNVCTVEELGVVVQESMDEVATKLSGASEVARKFRAYGFIVSGVVVSVVAIGKGAAYIPDEALARAFASAATTIALQVGASPILERISAFVKKNSYKLTLPKRHSKEGPANETDSDQFLTKLYGLLQGRLSPNQQAARGAFTSFYHQMTNALYDLGSLRWTTEVTTHQIETAADVMSNAVIYLRRMYPEQGNAAEMFGQADIQRATWLLFAKHLSPEHRVVFSELLEKSLLQNDPEASQRGVAEFYKIAAKKVAHVE